MFGDVGPVLVVGSYVSGLMCWRDLDVCLLAGVECSPADVLELLKRVVELPGFVGFTYRDERGQRSPTGEPRDERYHVPFDLDAGQGRWRIDLSVFLRDLHGHVAAWHEQLRDTIADQQRLAVLRIKDVWSGTSSRATPSRSVAGRSTPPCCVTASVDRSSSAAG
jgi:hypothetical protein